MWKRMKTYYGAGLLFFLLSCLAQGGEEVPPIVTNGDEFVAPESTPELERLPFTISASIREEYDDNILTSGTTRLESWKTILSPSLFFTTSLDQTLISLRATYRGVYFSNRPGGDWDHSAEWIGWLKHSFSPRVSLDVRNRFLYAQEPQLFDNLTVLQREGNYLSNVASVQLDIDWHPKFGTSTLWVNEVWDYEESSLAFLNNRFVNTVQNDFRFLVHPQVTAVVSGQYKEVQYDGLRRDFTNLVGDGGVDWQALPDLLVGARAGGVVTELLQGGSVVSPYSQFLVKWKPGKRSSIDFRYEHTISETDIGFASAQETDTGTLGLTYEWTSRLYTRVEGTARLGRYERRLEIPGATFGNFEENVGALQIHLGYALYDSLEFDIGYSYTTVSSPFVGRDYDRNRVYFGVRGVY